LVIGIGIGLVCLIVIILILVFTLGKKDHEDRHEPDDKPDWSDRAVNPYLIRESTRSYNARQYRLTRDTSIPDANFSESFRHFARETTHNKFIDNVTLRTAVVGGTFNTLRMTFSDEQNPDAYRVSDDFLSAAYAAEKTKNTRAFAQMEATRFALDFADDRRPANSSAFTLRAFYTTPEGKQEVFLTSKDQEFVMMTHYKQVTFEAHSQRLFGWGDHGSEQLYLQHNHSYTIFPLDPHGTSPASAHPFLMMQVTGTKRYAGIFLLNSAALSLEVQFLNNKTDKQGWAKLCFRATAGIMDFFVFYGPSFDQVVRQYQDLVGRPKMLPLWAHGFFSKSNAYKDSRLALEAIDGYQ
jgi:alpha-glucosidase (family GH31 glycosyl hydrolase)